MKRPGRLRTSVSNKTPRKNFLSPISILYLVSHEILHTYPSLRNNQKNYSIKSGRRPSSMNVFFSFLYFFFFFLTQRRRSRIESYKSREPRVPHSNSLLFFSWRRLGGLLIRRQDANRSSLTLSAFAIIRSVALTPWDQSSLDSPQRSVLCVRVSIFK